MSDQPEVATMKEKKVDGFDKWEIENAASTLKQAEEIKAKPKLLALAKKELTKQLNATKKALNLTLKNTF